jgi:hypothetical protein
VERMRRETRRKREFAEKQESRGDERSDGCEWVSGVKKWKRRETIRRQHKKKWNQ